MKFFQYIRIIFFCGPIILYHHFRYNIRFARHPEKYPFEERYNAVRKEVIRVFKHLHIDYNEKGFEKFYNLDKKALIISNHLSLIDPALVVARSEKPVTFVAKKECFKMPFVRQVCKAIEVFPLDRSNLMNQISVIKDVVKYLKDPTKPSVIIYIEGTRNRTPEKECLEFHPGTVKIAQMAGVPIISYAAFGSFRVISKHSALKRYPVSMSFLTIYSNEDVKKIPTPEFANTLKTEVDSEVDNLRRYDLEYIKSMKMSQKRKDLEARFDIRVNS